MSTTTGPAPTASLQGAAAMARELARRDGWTRDRLLAFQSERLRALIEHAVSASPYYRRVLDADAADAPLTALPTLSKTALMEHFDEIVTDSRLRRADLEHHLASQHPGRLALDRYRVFTTGGSTGVRGLFVLDGDEFVTWIAATLACAARMGVRPGLRTVGIGSADPRHASQQIFAALQAGSGVDAPRLSATTPLPEIVTALDAYRPDVLTGYASIIELLAEEQLRGRLHIGPTVVVGTSEVLTDNMRARTVEAWGVRPGEPYATTEAPAIAASCPAHVGLHVREDLVVIEVVDEQHRPVPPGVPGQAVLLTNLVNYTQPLIRYEITDLVTLAAGPNPTGMPYQRISAITGRSDDIVHLRGRDGGNVAVHPHQLRVPFAALSDVVQYQIVHGRGGLHVSVVFRPNAAADSLHQLRATLLDHLMHAGVVPPPITVTPVAAIPREPGLAAKFKTIKAEPA